MTHVKQKNTRRNRTGTNSDNKYNPMFSLKYISLEIIEQLMFSLLNQIIKRNYYTDKEMIYMRKQLSQLTGAYYFKKVTYRE